MSSGCAVLPARASDTDEYVVIHNRTAAPVTIVATDGSGGFAVAKEGGTLVFTIPDGTVIPAKGHFLGANTTNGATVLGVTPNATWLTDIADGLGLALFNSATAFTAPNLLDAVGFTPASMPRERSCPLWARAPESMRGSARPRQDRCRTRERMPETSHSSPRPTG